MVKIVWSVEDTTLGADVLVSLDEDAAVAFAKAQPRQYAGHFVVRRSHLVSDLVV